MKGFTLIELLVVVLIIGILSAVALPQYRKAVDKARLSEVISVLRVYRQGEEAYYLANGTYSDYPAELDVTIPVGDDIVSNEDKSYFFMPNKRFFFDLIGTVGVPSTYWVSGGLGELTGSTYADIQKDLTYTIYLDNSSYPGRVVCSGRTAYYESLCKSLGL